MRGARRSERFSTKFATLTSDSGIAAAALGQDFTEQVLAAAASVVPMVMVAPFHAVKA